MAKIPRKMTSITKPISNTQNPTKSKRHKLNTVFQNDQRRIKSPQSQKELLTLYKYWKRTRKTQIKTEASNYPDMKYNRYVSYEKEKRKENVD